MTTPFRDPYAILGVPRSASRETVAAAYRRLAKQHHPDRGGRHGRTMEDVNWAWSVLSDPTRRRAWDAAHATTWSHWRSAPVAPAPPPASPTGPATWPSGEPWSGGRPLAEEPSRGLGCLPLAVASLLVAAVILFAALSSGPNVPRAPEATTTETAAPAAP